MAGTIRENKTILSAEDRTAGAFASFTANIQKAQGAAMGLYGGLAGLAGGAVVGGLAAMVKSGLDFAESMNKASQKTGIAVEEMSQYAYAAKLADVSNESLIKGVRGLSEMMSKAQDATSLQSALFKSMGVDIKQGVAPAMEQIADQFAKLPDGFTKTTLAADLFGAKVGQEMIPFLNQGADGLRRMKAEADELGLSLTGEVAADAERFNDNMKAIGTGAAKTANTLTRMLAGSLADVSEAMKAAQKDAGLLGAAWVGMGGAASKLWDALSGQGGTEIEKAQRRIAEMNERLLQLRQRLEDSQNVVGPWGDKLRDGLIAAAIKGTKELAELNKQLADLYRQQDAEANRKKEAEAAKKLEEERLAKVRERFEAEKKAAEETKKWNERLQKEGIKGWVDYAQSVFDEADKLNLDLAKIAEDYWSNEDKLKKEDIKGWVAYAESVFEEADQLNRDLAKINGEYWDKVDRERKKADESTARSYEELADMGGRFFADLALNGRSAFDRLRDSLKSFAAELIALFAKRWILQMVAGATGSASLAASAATAGNGTMAGSLLNLGGSTAMLYGGTAVLGGLGGYLGSKAMGAGQHGQNVGAGAGAAGAALGMYVGGPVGAVIGALAGAVIGKFTDPNGLATRHGWFGDSSLGGDTRMRGSSVFGSFGITKSEWFGDDMIAKLSEFFKGLGGLEDTIAKYLNPAEVQRVKDALAGQSRQYDFGTEHGDFSGTLGQILKDRIDEIINIVDPSLKKWIDSFQGTGDELATYALDLLHVRDLLGDGSFESVLKAIPELTIEGLTKMQQAGEALSDTFTRVVNEFLQAQANLNAAIASRNPTFARELVLGNRNAIARQFLDSMGLLFEESALGRMALNPQSFSGLNTQQMQWLAEFLNLQTQLEQLDQQLAQGTQNISINLGNFNDAITSTVNALLDAQGGLADYLRGSLTGQFSPLNPMAQLAAARDNYTRNLSLAQGGDVNAIGAFGGLRDEYLRIARSIYASSGAYNDIFFSTFNQGAGLTGGQVGPLTGATYQQGVQQLATAVAEVATTNRATAQAVIALGNLIAEGTEVRDPGVAQLLEDIKVSLTRQTTGGVLA